MCFIASRRGFPVNSILKLNNFQKRLFSSPSFLKGNGKFNDFRNFTSLIRREFIPSNFSLSSQTSIFFINPKYNVVNSNRFFSMFPSRMFILKKKSVTSSKPEEQDLKFSNQQNSNKSSNEQERTHQASSNFSASNSNESNSKGKEREAILVEIKPRPFYYSLLSWIVGPLIFFGIGLTLLYFLSKEDKKSPLNLPISNAHQEIHMIDVKFDDVKGLHEVKDELKEVIDYLKNPEKYKRLGARLPKGVLLVGPPGTGKTLLARAVAGEAGVRFLYCSGSSFDELFVGVGPKRIRSLFEDAKKSPNGCIIFIDEIDTLGLSRQYSIQQSSSRESTLNQLLTELDGFKQTEGIIVMGATNFAESLDPALVRPGRFDKIIMINPPDVLGRKEILDYYLGKTKFDIDVDSSILARGTPGFTGADLSNLVNLAAIKASVNNQETLNMRNLEEAKDDVIMGIKRKGNFKDQEELKLTAYHEGGHALVALYAEGSHPLHKATIIQRGFALGVTVQLPEKDEQSVTKKNMMAKLTVLFGGRVAEELIFGPDEITSGASSDYQQANNLALKMATRYGMCPELENRAYTDLEKISEAEKKLIDESVKKLLRQAYDRAKAIISSHQKELHSLAEALLEHETLTGEEIKQVIKGKKLEKKLL